MSKVDAQTAGEKKALEDIGKCGCHIISVYAEKDLPPFCYSIGIQKSCGAPELVIFGLKSKLAGWMINEYNSRVRRDGSLETGKFYSGFIEGFDCLLEPVNKKHYDEYFGWNNWLYKSHDYDVVQLVYPTKSGVWPWQPEAENIRQWQPILTAYGLPVMAAQ